MVKCAQVENGIVDHKEQCVAALKKSRGSLEVQQNEAVFRYNL